MIITEGKTKELAKESGAVVSDESKFGGSMVYSFDEPDLFKFADLVSAHAIALHSEVRSMQTEQPVTREEIINIAEKAGAYVGGNYPQLIDGNHQVKVFEYTKKVIELVRSTNTDGWVLTLIDDDEIRTYKFYSLKNALNAQQDWLEQGIKSTIQPAPVTSMQGDSEPFGYFRAEPFGWTDCAEYDEGAIALYEKPQLSTNTDGWVSVDGSIAELERALAVIGVVGKIDGHDVIRRESMLDIARDRLKRSSSFDNADKLDAERYRWLRSDDIEFKDGMPYVAYDKRMLMDVVTIPLTESALDEAVDESMINAISQPKGE